MDEIDILWTNHGKQMIAIDFITLAIPFDFIFYKLTWQVNVKKRKKKLPHKIDAEPEAKLNE